MKLYCFLRSSIGKKICMSATGLIMSMFLVGHMAGNCFMFLGPEHYNKYGHAIVSNLPLLYGTETVLLVEDEKAVRDLSARVLSQQGYQVLEGINGKDAMNLAEKNKDKDIRLLFTDIVMPEMGGKELADSLKSLFPKIKVLFTSGYSDRDVVSRGLLERNAAFIQKPFSPQILLEKVREVLG